MAQKPLIGILGGMGSGKSTVSHLFSRHGAVIINADAIAHDVLTEPEIIRRISQRYGPEVIDGSNRVDRKKLAAAVFVKKTEVDFLNSLIHPRVLQKCESMIRNYQKNDQITAIVMDMPLLAEVGWQKRCDFLVFVDCIFQKRLERTSKKGKFDEKQLKKRENFQISLDKKKEISHYIVNNNSDLSDVMEQVARIFSDITGRG